MSGVISRPRRPGQSRVGANAEGLAEFLRQETTGCELLLAATGLALLWANVSQERAAAAVLVASVLASIFAVFVLRRRSRAS